MKLCQKCQVAEEWYFIILKLIIFISNIKKMAKNAYLLKKMYKLFYLMFRLLFLI